jgi:lipoprotein-anchoring transpeptidase ErfK/SrfK
MAETEFERMIARAAMIIGAAALGGLAACDDFRNAPAAPPAPRPAAATTAPTRAAPAITAAAGDTTFAVITPPPPADPAGPPPTIAASLAPQGQAIETADVTPTRRRARAAAGAAQPLLVRAEVLLGRAHFSPGVIDGRDGTNLKRAVAAYRQAHDLPAGGVDGTLLQSLTAEDTAPVTQDYVVTAQDEKGPFLQTVPTSMPALARLDRVGYATPLEALAEKFHMSEALMKTLNPDADFAAVGTRLVVVQADGPPLAPVAKVEVDKTANQVRALDVAGRPIAVFPATVGSSERPAPSGDWAVKAVTSNPNYIYDPSRLTFGDRRHGKLTIAPGPNNPVGAVWIALTAETYGIHGSPDPNVIGKTASHGCVRLTNWDAVLLGKALARGTPVSFVGGTTKL